MLQITLATQDDIETLHTCEVDKFNFLKHQLECGVHYYRQFVLAKENDKTVGIIQFVNDSARSPGNIGVGFVTVHHDNLNRGIASMMIDFLAKHAKKRRSGIYPGQYTTLGDKYIRHKFQQVCDLNNIPLHE